MVNPYYTDTEAMTPKRLKELGRCSLPKDCDAYREHMELVEEVKRLHRIIGDTSLPCICGPMGNTGAIPCPRHTSNDLEELEELVAALEDNETPGPSTKD